MAYDFSKFLTDSDFTKFSGFPFDFNALLETQRKNVQALTEAQQLALESLQTVAQRQAEILSRFVEDNSVLVQEIMTEGKPEDKVARQADLLRDNYEKSIASWNELADLVRVSNQEAAGIINKRVSASLKELKTALEKSAKPAKSETYKKAA